MWWFYRSHDGIPLNSTLVIIVRLGEGASWWLNGVEDIFGTSMTAATVSVLQSELQSCQELLEMEPDNKCVFVCVCVGGGGGGGGGSWVAGRDVFRLLELYVYKHK